MQGIRCGQCRKKLRVRPELAGRKVRCTHCGNVLTIPSFSASRSPEYVGHDLYGLEQGPASHPRSDADRSDPRAAEPVPPRRSMPGVTVRRIRQRERPVGITLYGWLWFLTGTLSLVALLITVLWGVIAGWGQFAAVFFSTAGIASLATTVPVQIVFGIILPKLYLDGHVGALRAYQGLMALTVMVWTAAAIAWLALGGSFGLLVLFCPLYLFHFGLFAYHCAPHVESFFRGKTIELENYFRSSYFLIPAGAVAAGLAFGLCLVLPIRSFVGSVEAQREAVAAKQVEVRISGVYQARNRNGLVRHLQDLVDSPQANARSHSVTGVLRVTVSPVIDVRAFAAKIDFGRVERVDEKARRIEVKADREQVASIVDAVFGPRAPPPVQPPDASAARAREFADAARQAVAQFADEPETSDPIDRALNDLRDKRGIPQTQAAETLARLPVDDDRRAEVVAALEPLLGDISPFMRVAAVKALAHWGGEEKVEVIAQLLDDSIPSVRETVMLLLAQFEDERIPAALAARLGDFFTRRTAQQALARMGPRAEEAVIPYLEHADRQVRQAACEVLGAIGTKASIPRLRRLARQRRGANAFVAQSAAQAIRAIEARPPAPRNEDP